MTSGYQFSGTSPKVNKDVIMLFLQKEGIKIYCTSSRIKHRSREKHRSGGVCYYADFGVAGSKEVITKERQ